MKNLNTFADFSKIVSNDKLRPVLQFAIVERGRLIATDSHVLAVSDLAKYVKPEELPFLENKAFNAELLKRLSKAKYLQFFEDHIICQEKNGISKLSYSGKILDGKRLEEFDEINCKFTGVGIYPNWAAIVPGFDYEAFKIDFSNYQLGPAAYNIKLLSNIGTALNSENLIVLSNGANRPTIILDYQKEKKDFSDFCLIMPLVNTPEMIKIFAETKKENSPEESPAAENYKDLAEKAARDLETSRAAHRAQIEKITEAAEQKTAELMAEIEKLRAAEAPKTAQNTESTPKQAPAKIAAKNARKNRFKKYLKYENL